MKFVSIGNHLILQKIEAVWRLPPPPPPTPFFLSPNCTWKLLGVGGDGILYSEKLVYAQMLLQSQHCSSPLLAWKGRSQKALLWVLFFLRSFMLSKASSRSQVMEQDCHWVLSCSVLPNKPFPFFSSFSPLKKWLKRMGMSVRFTEIPWNAADASTVPWEVVQLCLEATGCQQECGSQAETFHKTQHLAPHPQEFRPGNAWQQFCTLEHEQPVVPGSVSLAWGAKVS